MNRRLTSFLTTALATSLVSGLVTAGGLLTAGPAAAVDAVQLGAAARPAFIHSGQALTIVGAIRPARSKRMALQASTDGRTWTNTWWTTDAKGDVFATVRPTASTYYRWNFPGDATTAHALSAAVRPTVYPSLRSYPDCAHLTAHYPHGTGRPGAKDRTSGTPVTAFLPDAALYSRNDGGAGEHDLDRDNDGIACER